MEAKDKAKELLDKMNNHPVTKEMWNGASYYAKTDLKRKLYIVFEEILKELIEFDNVDGYAESRVDYWLEVKTEIENL